MRKIVFAFSLAFLGVSAYAGGSIEESSGGRVESAAGVGSILKSSEVKIDSLLGAVNQGYPDPEKDVGIIARTGHYQLSNRGQTELLLVGIQGRRIPFEELPPMNICFVIDKSGSMMNAGKMEWVKKSFQVFIAKVRPKDFVSLVLFDYVAQVAFPSTSMAMKADRERLSSVVRDVVPGGGTNLKAGLTFGYEQVMANFRGEYVNRVIFLTDGQGETGGLLDMAASYRNLGVAVSAVGLGQDFDQELIRSLALQGGGSSRFIADERTMVEAFGDGLPRMVAAVATDLTLDVAFDSGTTVRNVWAYEARTRGTTVGLSFPSVHVGDYETVLIEAETRGPAKAGTWTLARITGAYKDRSGANVSVEPVSVEVLVVDDPRPVDGYSDPYVLRAGTALDFGRALQEIGDAYGSAMTLGPQDKKRADLLGTAITRAKRMRDDAANAAMRLETAEFDRYVRTADSYLKTLGQALAWNDQELARYSDEPRMDPGPAKRRFLDEAEALFREVRAETGSQGNARLAIAGFTAKGAENAPLLQLLDRTAESALYGMPGFVLVDRRDLEKVLREQELAVSALMATESAIKVGQLVSATHILTGTVIPMKESVAVFARVVNVESGAIESVAQVVVPRTPEVEGLLAVR